MIVCVEDSDESIIIQNQVFTITLSLDQNQTIIGESTLTTTLGCAHFKNLQIDSSFTGVLTASSPSSSPCPRPFQTPFSIKSLSLHISLSKTATINFPLTILIEVKDNESFLYISSYSIDLQIQDASVSSVTLLTTTGKAEQVLYFTSSGLKGISAAALGYSGSVSVDVFKQKLKFKSLPPVFFI